MDGDAIGGVLLGLLIVVVLVMPWVFVLNGGGW